MSQGSCTPVVVDGWGGAGDGCQTMVAALGVLGAIEDLLRQAFPEEWRSSAADEYTARIGDLLLHAGHLDEQLRTAQQRAADLAAAVAAARSEP